MKRFLNDGGERTGGQEVRNTQFACRFIVRQIRFTGWESAITLTLPLQRSTLSIADMDSLFYGDLPIVLVRYVAEWFGQIGYDQVRFGRAAGLRAERLAYHPFAVHSSLHV